MGKVASARLPQTSALHALQQPGDFMDCYSAPGTGPLAQMATRMMTFPAWVRALMQARNLMVAPFGLQTEPQAVDRIGIFPVLSRSPEEIILGLDDSHLDFRVSLMLTDGQAYCATWVRTKNRFGRLYLSCILPFHIAIVRNAVARA